MSDADATVLAFPKPSRDRDPQYLAWVRGRPCCVCGAAPPSEPHHMVTRGAGGSDCLVVPVCRVCHSSAHSMGLQRFARLHGLWDKMDILRGVYESTEGSGREAEEALSRAESLKRLCVAAEEDRR